MKLLEDLDVPRPETHVVTSVEEALAVIKKAKYPMIMKATAVLDDLGRNDMTKYPLKGDAMPDYPFTRKRLESGLSIPITPQTPYIIQQFIEGSEWCTHATVARNKLVSFVCCPSSDMLMTYENWTGSKVGKQAEDWTCKFLAAWAASDRGKKEPFQGHFSMASHCNILLRFKAEHYIIGLYAVARRKFISYRMQSACTYRNLSPCNQLTVCTSLSFDAKP